MKKLNSKNGEIFYTVQGSGPLNFLLVHNSGGNHEMMSHTASYFSKQGKIFSPDLLGHGKSDHPKIEYTLKVFAEGLLELCQHEKIEKLIFTGLNYGANIGIEMAKIAPDLISHLILIEPPIFMEPWIVKVVEQQIKDLENPKDTWAQEVVDSVIVKAGPQEKEICLRALKMTPAFVKASTFKNLLAWDAKHLFNCPVPTLMIQVSQPFCSEEKVQTVFSNLQVGRVVGSGPWANLETPAQVHAMIDRFFELC